jgi:hypothetical protein
MLNEETVIPFDRGTVDDQTLSEVCCGMTGESPRGGWDDLAACGQTELGGRWRGLCSDPR